MSLKDLYNSGNQSDGGSTVYCKSVNTDSFTGSLVLNKDVIGTPYSAGGSSAPTPINYRQGEIVLSINGAWTGLPAGSIAGDSYTLNLTNSSIEAGSKVMVCPNFDPAIGAELVDCGNILVNSSVGAGTLALTFMNVGSDKTFTNQVLNFEYIIY